MRWGRKPPGWDEWRERKDRFDLWLLAQRDEGGVVDLTANSQRPEAPGDEPEWEVQRPTLIIWYVAMLVALCILL